MRRSQSAGARSGSAIESRPSARSPRRHSTKPPNTERAADPDPLRARADSAGGSRRRPAARLVASASAAKAAADDASPTPFGTPLVVRIRAGASMPASDLTTSTKRWTRVASSVGLGSPSISHSSCGPAPKPQEASIQRPSRVREMLPVVGRFSVSSRLPQYLINATLTLARAVVSAPDIVARCGSSPFICLPHPLTARSRPLGQRAV